MVEAHQDVLDAHADEGSPRDGIGSGGAGRERQLEGAVLAIEYGLAESLSVLVDRAEDLPMFRRASGEVVGNDPETSTGRGPCEADDERGLGRRNGFRNQWTIVQEDSDRDRARRRCR